MFFFTQCTSTTASPVRSPPVRRVLREIGFEILHDEEIDFHVLSMLIKHHLPVVIGQKPRLSEGVFFVTYFWLVRDRAPILLKAQTGD